MQIRLTTNHSRRRTPSWGRSRAGALFVAAFMAVGFLQATPAFAAVPELSVKDVRVTETDSGTTTANVRVVLSQPATSRVTAEYTTLDGTAKAADYVSKSGTLVIARGRQSVTVPVSVKGDELDERNEYFRFRISSPEHATIADRVGFIRVLDNDPQPYLDAGDLTVTEPASGVTVARLPVALSAVSGRWVYVDYVVSAGSATVDTDFYAAEPTGTLVFPPGTTSRSVSIVVLSDLVDENTEWVYVTLHDPVHGYIYDGTGVASIVEDEPSLSIDDRTVVEGQTATFTVKLDRVSNETVTVYYSTASGTAASSSDFYSTSGYLTFSPGTTSKTVNVYTVDDSTSESTETFTLNLSNAVNADIADNSGRGTINDNDGLTLNVGDVTVTEGSSAGFRVYLTAKTTSDVTFDYVTVEGSADEPSDFTYRSGNNVVIPKGQTEVTVYVSTVDDKLDESSEVFYLYLSDIHNAKPGDTTGMATILDNELTVNVDDASAMEGQVASFRVWLSESSSREVRVDWATVNNTASSSDYKQETGTVVIPAYSTVGWVQVSTTADAADELDETFLLRLSNPQGAALGDYQATGTIDDNDGPVVTLVADVSQSEATTPMVFTATLSAESPQPVVLTWGTLSSTSEDAATAGTDYASVSSGTITIPAGAKTATFNVAIVNDTIAEADEVFKVKLLTAADATIGTTAQATATILDDDA